MKVNKDALIEYERLNEMIFSTVKRDTFLDNTHTITFHNTRSLPKHVGDIVSSGRIINNDIKGFTETQIILSTTTGKIMET